MLLSSLVALAQTVRIEVIAPDAPADVALHAQTTWLGEDRETALTDDGRVPGDRAADGIRVATWTGDAVRILPIWIVAKDADGVETSLAGFNEVLGADEERIVYAIEWRRPPRVRRVAAALASRPMEVADTAAVAASFGWAGLVLAWVAWLARRMPEAP